MITCTVSHFVDANCCEEDIKSTCYVYPTMQAIIIINTCLAIYNTILILNIMFITYL